MSSLDTEATPTAADGPHPVTCCYLFLCPTLPSANTARARWGRVDTWKTLGSAAKSSARCREWSRCTMRT